MDPITLALIAVGLGALVTAVFFFLKSKKEAEEYKKAVEKANSEMAKLRRRVQEEEQKRKTLEKEQDIKKLQDLIREINEEEAKWKKENNIASSILVLAGTPTIPNALKLARLILESFILRKHLKNPQGAKADVQKRVEALVKKFEDTIDS